MAFTTNKGVRLFWAEQGAGTPIRVKTANAIVSNFIDHVDAIISKPG